MEDHVSPVNVNVFTIAQNTHTTSATILSAHLSVVWVKCFCWNQYFFCVFILKRDNIWNVSCRIDVALWLRYALVYRNFVFSAYYLLLLVCCNWHDKQTTSIVSTADALCADKIVTKSKFMTFGCALLRYFEINSNGIKADDIMYLCCEFMPCGHFT